MTELGEIAIMISNSLTSTFRNFERGRDSFNFDSEFKNAQQNHLVTGMWGSCKYYIDKNDTMHVGQGTLNRSLYDVIGDKNAHLVKALNFNQRVTAPNDSYRLLSVAKYGETNNTLAQINNLGNIDVSHVSSMHSMFANDTAITDLDLSSWGNINSDIFTDTANLNQITLDNNSNLDSGVHLPGSTWKNKDNGETLTSSQLTDGNSHAGTWVKQ